MDLTPYGRERWEAGKNWQPGLKSDGDQSEGPIARWLRENPMFIKVTKPFLTAADLVFLREMKVGL